jgi:hypothetical protein
MSSFIIGGFYVYTVCTSIFSARYRYTINTSNYVKKLYKTSCIIVAKKRQYFKSVALFLFY